MKYTIRTIDGKNKSCRIEISMHSSRLASYLDYLERSGHHSIVIEVHRKRSK
jgi:hypothetical protein